MGRRARTRHGRCWAAGRPGWSGCTPRIPEGGKPDWRFSSGRGMRRVAAVGPARQGVRSSSAVAPCGCARLGKGRAGKRRDVPLKAAGGPKGTGLGPFFSGPEDSDPSCLFFFPACRGLYAACGSGLRSSARNGCSRRHWVGFRVRSDPGWLSAVVCAKPRAFAMFLPSAGAPQVLRGELCALLVPWPHAWNSVPWIRSCRLPFYLEERRQQTIISQLSMKIKSLGRIAAKGPDSPGQCVVGSPDAAPR